MQSQWNFVSIELIQIAGSVADTCVLFWSHWYLCFGFLVRSPLGFKARVGCLIRIVEANVMYIS